MLLWRWWGCPRQWFVFFYWNVDVLTNQRRTRVRRVGNTFINHALHAQTAGRQRRGRGRGQVAVTGIEQGYLTATAQEIENQNAMTFPGKEGKARQGNGEGERFLKNRCVPFEVSQSWRVTTCDTVHWAFHGSEFNLCLAWAPPRRHFVTVSSVYLKRPNESSLFFFFSLWLNCVRVHVCVCASVCVEKGNPFLGSLIAIYKQTLQLRDK